MNGLKKITELQGNIVLGSYKAYVLVFYVKVGLNIFDYFSVSIHTLLCSAIAIFGDAHSSTLSTMLDLVMPFRCILAPFRRLVFCRVISIKI